LRKFCNLFHHCLNIFRGDKMKIYVPGKSPVQVYPSGGMVTTVPGGGAVEVNKHEGSTPATPGYFDTNYFDTNYFG